MEHNKRRVLDRQTVGTYVESEVLEQLKRYSEDQDRSLSWVVRQAVNEYIKKIELQEV